MTRYFLLILLILTGCIDDAPRDNPLDGQAGLPLTGTVKTYYAPHKPLSLVSVQLNPLNLITLTNEQGVFEFNNLKPDSYTVVVGGGEFSRDSMTLFLKNKANLSFLIDQLPVFEEIHIESHHQARWFPVEDTYFLHFTIRLNDADGIGDLHMAYVQIPAIGLTDTLAPGADPGEFYSILNVNDLNINHLEELIGKEIIFKADDDVGYWATSRHNYLTRVIQQSAQLISPVGLETITSDTIHFQWQPIYLNFPFSYKLEIFQINNGIISTVKTISPIASDVTSFDFIHQLTPGEYLWRIYIVDEYGNTSGSREGAFQIP